MKLATDIQLINALKTAQHGVFSKADLQTLLAEKHARAFIRRLTALQHEGVLKRFVRGWYVTPEYDAFLLSQRMAPDSYISFGTVLARALAIGTQSEREVWAVKIGRSRIYKKFGYCIRHFGIASHLLFGFEQRDGLRWATPEKALLDTLYFFLRGQRYAFDIYSDLNLNRFDLPLLFEFLERFRNPKFKKFVRSIIRGS
jgi:hypothetical protein